MLVCIVPVSFLRAVNWSDLSGMYELLLERHTSGETMGREVKKSSSPGLPWKIVQLPSEVPLRKKPRGASSNQVQAKADVGLEKKLVPVQANLRSTCCSNAKEVKTLIQVSLGP